MLRRIGIHCRRRRQALAPLGFISLVFLVTAAWDVSQTGTGLSWDGAVLVMTSWSGYVLPLAALGLAGILGCGKRIMLAMTTAVGLGGILWCAATAISFAEIGHPIITQDVLRLAHEPILRSYVVEMALRPASLALVAGAVVGLLLAQSGYVRFVPARIRWGLTRWTLGLGAVVTGSILIEQVTILLTSDPDMRWIGHVCSLRTLLGLLLVLGGNYVFWHIGMRRTGWRRATLLVLVMVPAAILTGSTASSMMVWRIPFVVAQREVTPVWGLARHLPKPGSGIIGNQPTTPALAIEMSRRIRSDLRPPFWMPGPEPILATLAQRYPGRSCVLVVMESQALVDICGYGTGPIAAGTAGRELARLAKDNLFFSNWTNCGLSTVMAHMCITLGGPVDFATWDNETDGYASECARSGRATSFRDAGYSREWLMSTDTSFLGLRTFLHQAGFSMDVPEAATQDKSRWNSWGMPDDQLLDIALQRIRAWTPDRHLMVVATISNHGPFTQPETFRGEPLPSGRPGATMFADRCIGSFVDSLSAIPAEIRPIVLITADHGVARETASLAELWRLPGILILPDDAARGRVSDTPISAADALDLLWHLSGPADPGPRRWVDVHRDFTAFCTYESTWFVITREQVFNACSDRYVDLIDRWNGTVTDHPTETMLRARHGLEARAGAMIR